MVGGRDRRRDDGGRARPTIPSCSAATSASSRSRTRLRSARSTRMHDPSALVLRSPSARRSCSPRAAVADEPTARSRLRQHPGRRLRDLRDECGRGGQQRLTRPRPTRRRRPVSSSRSSPLVARRSQDRVREQARAGRSTSTSCAPTGPGRGGSRRRMTTTRTRRGRPTGSQIAFVERADDIYVMNADGSDARRDLGHRRPRSRIPRGLRTATGSPTSVGRPARTTQRSGSCVRTDPSGSADEAARRERSRPAWSPDSSRDRVLDERRG